MDVQLSLVEKGSGFPLVLLHGNGESKEYFAHQMDAFARYARVLAIDTRGHGRSPRGTAPFTLSQFAEDLKAFLDERGIESTDILGFSDGANTALIFALKYPSCVRRLILNGGNLDPRGVKWHVQMPILLAHGLASLGARFSARAAARQEMLGLMVTQPHITKRKLRRLSMPVLVVAGKHDMIKDSHTGEINRAIRSSRLCILEGDHFLAQKRWKSFNRAVIRFLWEGL